MKKESLTTLRFALIGVGSCAALCLAACREASDDLHAYLAAVQARPVPSVAPLPSVSFVTARYDLASLRSPFVAQLRPSVPASNAEADPLVQYPLDRLRLVGSLRIGNRMFGFIQIPDGTVLPATMGSRLGQQQGVVVEVLPDAVHVVEQIADGAGGTRAQIAVMTLAGGRR